MTVLEKFEQGDIRSLARIVSYVENRSEGYQQLLGRLYPQSGKSLRIGLTGPPGAGKSTIVNSLAHQFITTGKKVGIIAVDPSSPFTGGALLGDRVRMSSFQTDCSVYFRSMASRGATGGLASATDNVAIVYDAFGFDITLIETVGVGQVELEIIDSCDSVTVVLVPESGDAVQALKAGLMEIADIFCVNKADRPGAERMKADLNTMLETRSSVLGDWKIPIIATKGIKGTNLDQLFAAINSHIDHCQTKSLFQERRRHRLRKKIISILSNRFKQEFVDLIESKQDFDREISSIISGKTNPYEVCDKFYSRIIKS